MGPPASRSGYLLLRCAIYRLDFVAAAGLTGRCTEARDVPQNLAPRDTDPGERVMKQALQQMLGDLLSAIRFLIVYAVSGSLFVAVGIAVTAGFMQFAFLRLMRRRIEPMQWMSLGLVVVLGGATMLTQSPRFMMIKPTIVHFTVAAVMLRPGWMIRYLPEVVVRNVPEPAIVAAGYGWAALLVALGLANLFIALRFDITTWAWFISVGSVGTKLAAFALQYGVFQVIVRQRLAQSAV